jgi:hypothetical protein
VVVVTLPAISAGHDSVQVVPCRPPPGRRLAAWLYTGPIGHLYSTLADLAVLWVRYGRHRLGRRLRAGRG